MVAFDSSEFTMTDLCTDLEHRLRVHEWYHENETFVSWLKDAQGIESCIATGLHGTVQREEWATFEGYVYAASLRPDTRYTSTLGAVLRRHELDVNYEDIVDTLGEGRDPAAIGVLAETMLWEPEWDEFRALAVKCVWALAWIGTDEAWAVLDAMEPDQPETVRRAIDSERTQRRGGPAPM
jgi:hypothetical protein